MSEGKDFIRKHKPLTPKELRDEYTRKEQAKKDFATDAVELEKELECFNKITEPLVNPATGKAICWIRRPTQAEWENMLPQELVQYRDCPESIPPELQQKWGDMTFELMALIIEKPKHDSKWWKAHSTINFIELFNVHLSNIFTQLAKDTTNF
jgi:hypothetical protein